MKEFLLLYLYMGVFRGEWLITLTLFSITWVVAVFKGCWLGIRAVYGLIKKDDKSLFNLSGLFIYLISYYLVMLGYFMDNRLFFVLINYNLLNLFVIILSVVVVYSIKLEIGGKILLASIVRLLFFPLIFSFYHIYILFSYLFYRIVMCVAFGRESIEEILFYGVFCPMLFFVFAMIFRIWYEDLKHKSIKYELLKGYKMISIEVLVKFKTLRSKVLVKFKVFKAKVLKIFIK